MIPVISFVGNSNCGKTTYLGKLICEMKRRGFKVGIIKHDVHGFDIDKPGKDTWRHCQAGADIVCISSYKKLALIKRTNRELSLEEVLQYFNNVDIVFTEGYKKEGMNKVEIFRSDLSHSLVCSKAELLAVVSDVVVYSDILQLPLNDVQPMANFIIEKFLPR